MSGVGVGGEVAMWSGAGMGEHQSGIDCQGAAVTRGDSGHWWSSWGELGWAGHDSNQASSGARGPIGGSQAVWPWLGPGELSWHQDVCSFFFVFIHSSGYGFGYHIAYLNDITKKSTTLYYHFWSNRPNNLLKVILSCRQFIGQAGQLTVRPLLLTQGRPSDFQEVWDFDRHVCQVSCWLQVRRFYSLIYKYRSSLIASISNTLYRIYFEFNYSII